MQNAHASGVPDAATDGDRWLAFLLSGIAMSFLGATLPGWGYHLVPAFPDVGNYFLVMALGFVLSIGAVHTFLLPGQGLPNSCWF